MTDISRRTLAAGAGLLIGAIAARVRAQQMPPQAMALKLMRSALALCVLV